MAGSAPSPAAAMIGCLLHAPGTPEPTVHNSTLQRRHAHRNRGRHRISTGKLCSGCLLLCGGQMLTSLQWAVGRGVSGLAAMSVGRSVSQSVIIELEKGRGGHGGFPSSALLLRLPAPSLSNAAIERARHKAGPGDAEVVRAAGLGTRRCSRLGARLLADQLTSVPNGLYRRGLVHMQLATNLGSPYIVYTEYLPA